MFAKTLSYVMNLIPSYPVVFASSGILCTSSYLLNHLKDDKAIYNSPTDKFELSYD